MKFNLKMYDITSTRRQDEANYLEGMTTYDTIMVGLYQGSWLQPGVTFTNHLLRDAGKIEVPKITGAEGGVTDLLNTAANVGTANVAMVYLEVDKKVSAKFDGTFTLTGIADKNIELGLNNYKIRSMKTTKEKYVHGKLVAGATTSLVDKADFVGNPYQYLNAMKTEYAKNTLGMMPTIALVSYDFLEELTNADFTRETNQGDAVLITGALQGKLGLLVIPVHYQTIPVILYSADGLHLGTPVNTKSIGDTILGDIESMAGVEFRNGIVTMNNTDASKLKVETYVHNVFGALVPETLYVLAAPVVAPSPDPVTLVV